MDELQVRVLKTSSLTAGDGSAVPVRSAKAKAVLFYLAVEGTPQTRPALAGLLWGDRAEANARGSLRLALMELRRAAGSHLLVDRTHVAFDRGRPYSLDWADLVENGSVPADYHGGFLDDLVVADAPAFDDWVAGRRRQAGHAAAQALGERARAAWNRGDCDGAVRLARRVLAVDGLDESAHRLIIEVLSATGNRAGALTQYEACRRSLDRELGVAPDPRTQALRQRIALGGPSGHSPARGAQAAAPLREGPRGGTATRRLPRPLTRLIGREAEIENVRAKLRDREVRLLTLTGPGGVGKTRLAVAVAERLDEEVLFVSFTSVRPKDTTAQPYDITAVAAVSGTAGEVDVVATTLAEAVGVDLTPPRPARDLLLAAVRHRDLILVLDNLEHLPSVALLAGAILSAAPAVRILATSRRRMGICAEHVHEVPALCGASARALLLERARALVPTIAPDTHALDRVCRAVGGLPLAVELAATLTRAMTCEEIAEHLHPGGPAARAAHAPADLLVHPQPAATTRHASMKQVFDTSWRLLTAVEQRALAAVSVFAGGFTLAAGIEVAGTTAVVVARLIDHSLVRRDQDGRHRVHELVRQYAVAHLADESPRARHAAWYARFLRERAGRLRDYADTAVLGEIEPEIDDVRQAWRHAVHGPADQDRAAFAESYWTLCLRRHCYAEALSVAHDMIAAVRPEDRAASARWHRLAGLAHFQFERGAESLTALRRALAIADRPLPSTWAEKASAVAGGLARQVIRRTTPLSGRARTGPARELAAEAARTLSVLAELGYHRQEQGTMLLSVVRHLDAAERAGGPVERGEAYANVAVVAALAGSEAVARRYGRLADEQIATVPDPVAVSRARLARGLRLITEGRFAAAHRVLTLARRHPADPRLAEHCLGLLADLEIQRGCYAAAAQLMAAVAETSVTRMGETVSGYWGLTGQAEALLRLVDGDPADVSAVLKAAEEATLALPVLGEDHFARAGAKIPAIQRLRLGVARARFHLLGDDVPAARLALDDALRTADRPDMPLRGTLEAWAGLAEVLWALEADDPAVREVARHMSRLARRTPSAAPRMGWATALTHEVTGRRPRARLAAGRALAAARRLGIAFDEARSLEVLGETEEAARIHARLGTAPVIRRR
ncbi:ATP-binding protein [Microbispora sp. H10670]|uniref:ATP-binding protein n=1 Tax=Microbispora sp. H10670 TaxID=2729108 RepID=UPI001603F155|nr:BTAD domain-containing putative transcriptional regulator [Microbispora sp. H10670]